MLSRQYIMMYIWNLFVSRALSDWEQRGYLKWLVTQNVDALHTKAGSENVTELHGCSHRVVCLHCPEVSMKKILVFYPRPVPVNRMLF